MIEKDNLELTCEVILREKTEKIKFTWYRILDDGQENVITDRNITTDPGDDTQAPLYFKKSFLQLDNVQFKDRGLYVCEAMNEAQTMKGNNTVYVRIKSRMAALYPFLGICAEVTILCVIIFVYERRRSKSELGRGDASSYDKGKSQAKMS